MAVNRFLNGVGGNTWETAGNWDLGHVPIDNETIRISVNCNVSTDYSDRTFEGLTVDAAVTLTVASGGDIRFDTAASVSLTGSLTIETGGNAYFTDCGYLRSTGGTITLDGGTLWIVETDNSLMYLDARGNGIVGTANGGTIKLSATNALKVYIASNAQNYIGNSGNRLVVEGDAGAQTTYANFVTTTRLENIDFDSLSYLQLGPVAIDNCLIHGGTDGVRAVRSRLHIRNTFIYGHSGYGLKSISNAQYAYVRLHKVVFGETEGQVGSENTTADIDLPGLAGVGHDCKLASTTPVSFSGGPLAGTNFSFTSYDQDEADWRDYQDLEHYAQAESGAGAQGGSGTAVKCVSSASAADNNWARFRRLVAVIPATHGDLIDATLYIKGTNTKTATLRATLRIDPDSIYGTTQSYAETADGNWNQRTIPQYTVNLSGGVGAQAAIPIYLDMTGASETWYYDTLDWTIS
jgi:hypothetical protein